MGANLVTAMARGEWWRATRARQIAAALAATALAAALCSIGGRSTERAAAAFPGLNGPIAFASDRTGHMEIFTMRADGSHVECSMWG